MLADYARLTEELAEAGSDAVARGLTLASGGNLSAREPGADTFVITGTGTYLDRLDESAFSLMDLDGNVLGGEVPPSSEWKLHQRTYRMRPDINSVIHLHPQYSVLLDALGYEIRLITLDHAYYLRNIERCDYYPNGTDELGDTAAEAARDCNAIILAYHGSSTLGDTVAMAYRRAMNLEEAASTTYRCLTLGNTDLTFPKEEWAQITTPSASLDMVAEQLDMVAEQLVRVGCPAHGSGGPCLPPRAGRDVRGPAGAPVRSAAGH